MVNANDVRNAHHILDELDARAELSQEQEKLLRSFLPERPNPVTLDVLLARVHDAWIKANPSDWGFDTPAEHHDWLFDLRNDLVRILQEQDTPAAVPALPAGMRLADHEQYGRVITSPKPNRDGVYDLLVPRPKFETGADWEYAHECELTFIDGSTFRLAPPEFLETEADYENAPEGTIVACDDSPPWHKFDSVWLSTITHGRNSAKDMTGVIREVLRWGNE